MARSLSVLQKILFLTESSNPNEARAAEEKLEQQLLEKGITKEQLEQMLENQMSAIDEQIEAISFRYGKRYKRIDPAVSTLVTAVAEYFNGKIVFTVNDEDGKYMNHYRQIEISANRSRQIEIELYTDYLVQALQDQWVKHCQEDPFKVAFEGAAYRNNFRKGFAIDVQRRFQQMKRDEQTNGRQIQTENRTLNQSALAVTKANQTELAVVEKYYKEKYPRLGRASSFQVGGDGTSAGRAAGSSVGLSRQVAGGGYKQLGGY